MSNPNPHSHHNPTRLGELDPSRVNNAGSSTSTATLGRSGHTSRGTSTYNLDRFLEQDVFDDANLHGRVPEHAIFHLRPKAFVRFYKAKAASGIDDFNVAFDKASGSGSGGQ